MSDNSLYRYCAKGVSVSRIGVLRKETYHGRLLTGRVVYKSERVVEVVEVHLALGLKLVEEVEETKRERSAGASTRCGEPAGTEQLGTAGGGWDPTLAT